MIRSNKKEKLFIIALVILMVLICYIHAIEAGKYVNFYPINGTFQNFNPIRRLLDGQIPYRDFTDYLGMGHLFSGAVLTILLGGDYQASLVTFSFLTLFSFALILCSVGFCLCRRKSTVLIVVNLLLILTLLQLPVFTNTVAGTNEFMWALNNTLDTGVSARLVRGMIAPISGLLLLKLIPWLDQTKNEKIQKRKALWQLISVGCVAGLSFIWSYYSLLQNPKNCPHP